MKCANGNCGYVLSVEEIEMTWHLLGEKEVAICPLCGKRAAMVEEVA
jgi:hypothetical protein